MEQCNSQYWVDSMTGEPRFEFESFYQNVDDPWGCSALALSDLNLRLVNIVREYSPTRVLDYGCGLGDLTNLIDQSISGCCSGVEVSQTAVSKAKLRFPGLQFHCGSLLDVPSILPSLDPPYDCIVLSEVIWYICHEFSAWLRSAKMLVERQSLLIIKQFFPRSQRYFPDFTSNTLLNSLQEAGLVVELRQIDASHPDGEVHFLVTRFGSC
jgi:SAM-dependent methyltransferase